MNGDVFTDYPLARLTEVELGDDMAHLVMVPNPEHHPSGDFAVSDARVGTGESDKATFSGLSVMSHSSLMIWSKTLRHFARCLIVRLHPGRYRVSCGRGFGQMWEHRSVYRSSSLG